MLQNKIYQNFIKEILKTFLVILFGLSIVAWTVRAVNFLDLIVENGYSIATYFQYSFLNLLGILTKLIPLSFLISLVIFIVKQLRENELVILWTSGEKKAKLQVTGRDVEDIELSLKLNEEVMHWQIDKNQDETPLTGLQKSVLDLVSEEPTSTKSSIIASKLNKEQSQISGILKKLKVKGYIYNPHYGEYSKTSS